MIVDSQAVKNTCNAQVQSKGFCHYKTTNGIKRHLAIDTLGFPFFTHCTKGSVSDDWGLIEMFTKNIDYFKSKPVYIPKITILLDTALASVMRYTKLKYKYFPMKSYSVELREKIVAAPINKNFSIRKVANLFSVSKSLVQKLVKQ